MQILQNLPMMTITRSDQNKEDNTMAEREKNEKSTVRPMKRTRKKVCAFCADRAEFLSLIHI